MGRKHDLIGRLASEWQPQDIRQLAANLLQLADTLDLESGGESTRTDFAWPADLAWVERNAGNLAAKARMIWEQRDRRRRFLDGDLLGEPAWDMLLDLFIHFAAGAKVSTTSLCIASRVPNSTALRHIGQLEKAGYAERSQSGYDRRVTFVALTEKGVLAMGRYLEQS